MMVGITVCRCHGLSILALTAAVFVPQPNLRHEREEIARGEIA